MQNTLPEFPVVVVGRSEYEFHSATDFLQASNRRKTVWMTVMGLVMVAQFACIIFLASKGRPTYVVAVAPDGQEYVISTPKKAVELRDAVIFNAVKQDLTSWASAYYERSIATAAKDTAKARWFMTDPVAQQFDSEALGPKGWIAKLQQGQLGESHVHVDNVVIRDADVQTLPYKGQIYYTRIPQGRAPEHWRSEVTFVVSPEIVKGPFPLYNALGVFLVKAPEESQEFAAR